MKYASIKDYQANDKLPGAVSVDTEFSYVDNNDVSFIPLRDYVPDNYAEDLENGLFVSHDGAVANAFDMKFLNEEEKKEAIKEILTEYRMKYPEYDFELKQAQFPVKVDLGYKLTSGYRLKNYSTMSTHVLFIKNFGKYVKTPKLLIKRNQVK